MSTTVTRGHRDYLNLIKLQQNFSMSFARTLLSITYKNVENQEC